MHHFFFLSFGNLLSAAKSMTWMEADRMTQSCFFFLSSSSLLLLQTSNFVNWLNMKKKKNNLQQQKEKRERVKIGQRGKNNCGCYSEKENIRRTRDDIWLFKCASSYGRRVGGSGVIRPLYDFDLNVLNSKQQQTAVIVHSSLLLQPVSVCVCV